MRKRYQKPRIKNVGGYWIGQYRDLDGVKRKVSLGPVKRTTKYDAEQKFANILRPVNAKADLRARNWTFGQFVNQIYLPFYKRKWKDSTAECNEERIGFHLMPIFGERGLSSFTRDELQEFLERKTDSGLSYSLVAHLRWDMNQVFKMAVAEGLAVRNSAELLFIPAGAPRPEKTYLTFDQVRIFFSVLDLRERLIGGFAILAGMRPGEIFGLTRARLDRDYADIQQRIYRGEVGTPKTFKSKRWAALGDGLSGWIRQWLDMQIDTKPDAWVFPSERMTPLSRDNCWRRHFLPRLKTVGLEWVNFQVMRRTHSCLLNELDVDPQVRAGQMGHSVDVNQNEYTQASLERKRKAVNALEDAVGIM